MMTRKKIANGLMIGLVLTLAASANAAIMVDNGDSVAVNNTKVITITDFAIGDNNNRLLIVTIGNEYGEDNIASVTFGGVAMALQTQFEGASMRGSYIYSLADPTVGATDDIVVTWGAGVPSGREDSQVAAMSLYGDNALSIVETHSGRIDLTPVFTTFDQATVAFFYAGVHVVNGNVNITSTTFDALPSIGYDSGNAVLASHTSRTRGHYFATGTGGSSLLIDSPGDSYPSSSRIAIQEAGGSGTLIMVE